MNSCWCQTEEPLGTMQSYLPNILVHMCKVVSSDSKVFKIFDSSSVFRLDDVIDRKPSLLI